VSLVSNTKSTIELFLAQEKLFGASCETLNAGFLRDPQQLLLIRAIIDFEGIIGMYIAKRPKL